MMPMFTFPLPAATDPARVDAFLMAKGYTIADGSSLHSDGSVSVSIDRDPASDLPAYTDVPTPGEQALQTAQTVIANYIVMVKAILPAARTPEQKVILAILRVVAGMENAQ